MSATVNVNGRIFDEEHAVISVFDHGFLYGEGVYETLRTYNGRPFLFDRHMRRLRTSADMLALPVPISNTTTAAIQAWGAAMLNKPNTTAFQINSPPIVRMSARSS